MLDFGEAVRRFYGNYTNPEGRAQRSAYWWVQLYQTIIVVVLCIVMAMADGGIELMESLVSANEIEDVVEQWANLGFSGKAAIYCLTIFSVVNFLPGIMLGIRRFHDLGQTGWLVLVFFIVGAIPGVGTLANIANFIWFILRGTVGPNQYGPDPLGHDTDVFG